MAKEPRANSIVDVVGNVEELRELCNEVKDALDSNNARLAAILLDSVPAQFSLSILYADVYRLLKADCEKAASESPDEVLHQPAGRRKTGTEAPERVTTQGCHDATDKERFPHGAACHGSSLSQQGEDACSDHRADPQQDG